MRISDWSSDVCSSDLSGRARSCVVSRLVIHSQLRAVDGSSVTGRRLASGRRVLATTGAFGSVAERIADQDRVFAFGARRYERDRGFNKFLHALDIFDRLRREVGIAARAGGDRKSTRLNSSP